MSEKGAKRSYGDACGISRALDVVGERWALMVVRELLLGPKRFTDIRRSLPKLSADVLAQRLRGLEEAGILRHRTLPPPAASQVYELTAAGRALEPVLHELGRWGGANAPPPEEGMCMSLDSHLVSLRTLFDSERAAGISAIVQLRLDGSDFVAEVAGGEIAVRRGEADSPGATIEAGAGALLDVLHGRRELREALAAGDVRFAGDEELAARFTTFFPLPQPAAA
jgi:DNA-binding HxlR family transcriptional regulator